MGEFFRIYCNSYPKRKLITIPLPEITKDFWKSIREIDIKDNMKDFDLETCSNCSEDKIKIDGIGKLCAALFACFFEHKFTLENGRRPTEQELLQLLEKMRPS